LQENDRFLHENSCFLQENSTKKKLYSYPQVVDKSSFSQFKFLAGKRIGAFSMSLLERPAVLITKGVMEMVIHSRSDLCFINDCLKFAQEQVPHGYLFCNFTFY
jgi:hypothetical protein